MKQYDQQVRQQERPIRYFAQDESRFGLKTLIGRLITACGVKPIGPWQWLFKAFWLYGADELPRRKQRGIRIKKEPVGYVN